MAKLSFLLVCTFGKVFEPILVAPHTVNNLDIDDGQGFVNEGYESD